MKYAFDVSKFNVDGHEYYGVTSKSLKGCVAQGDTLDEALALFSELEKEWIETAKKYNIEIPAEKINSVLEYSGKFTVRLSKSLHEKVSNVASDEGISLNTLVSNILSEFIGYRNGMSSAKKDVCAWIDTLMKSSKQYLENDYKKKYTPMTYTKKDTLMQTLYLN